MPFPILFGTTVTTVLHYRADCDFMLCRGCDSDMTTVLYEFIRYDTIVYCCFGPKWAGANGIDTMIMLLKAHCRFRHLENGEGCERIL